MSISPVEECLFAAMDAEDVLVLSIDKEGEITLHTTMKYGPDILWTLEHARHTTLLMAQSGRDG